MINNHKEILLKLLEVIGYKDDKDAFVSEFERNIHLQSIADLVRSLPLERQEEVKQKLNQDPDSPEKGAAILKSYFSEPQILDALESAAKNSLTKYIQAIRLTLTDLQRENLKKFSRNRENLLYK